MLDTKRKTKERRKVEMTSIKERRIRIFCVLILFAGVLIFYGPQIAPDSPGYIAGKGIRAVLYPAFLWFNRWLCAAVGIDNYLWLVIIEQNLLAVISICLLAESWIKRWKIGPVYSGIVYVSLTGIWFFELLMDSWWTTNAILTEGLCFSLFYLCIFFFLKYFDEKSWRWLCGLFLSVFLMVLCRKAVLVFLPCFMFGIVWIEKKWNRKVWVMLFLVGGMLLLFSPLTSIYNYCWGNESEITGYDANLLANFGYFGTQEDYDSLNEDEAVIYEYVYQNLYDGGYTYELASREYSGFELTYQRSHKYDYASFDLLSIAQLNQICLDFGEKYQLSKTQAVSYTKEQFRSLEIRMIRNHWKEVLYGYVMRGLEGMIRTVFLDIKGFRIGALFLYIVYFGLMIFNRKNKKMLEWSIFLLILMLVNSYGVATVIFPTYRYMAYNMGLFYLTLFTHIYLRIKGREGNR
jgi:hypothetical protein